MPFEAAQWMSYGSGFMRTVADMKHRFVDERSEYALSSASIL